MRLVYVARDLERENQQFANIYLKITTLLYFHLKKK